MSIKIGIYGARGRMSSAVAAAIQDTRSGAELAGIYSSLDHENLLQALCDKSDVIIDFSTPEALPKLLPHATKAGTKLLIGTTGLNKMQFESIKLAAQKIAIMYAANTSIGMNVTAALAAKAAKLLQQYDVEIVEKHHRGKQDAPSGTALMLGKAIAEERNLAFDAVVKNGRAGHGARQVDEIGISAVRAGGIFGEHDVIFADDHEIITISHQALNRSAFASGALKAAIWLCSQKAGYYTMQEMLQLT